MKKQELAKLENASDILKTVGHPMRIAIIELLRANRGLTVTEIHESLGILQAIASQHLALLKEIEVVGFRRKGRNVRYFISNKKVFKLIDLAKSFN